MSLELLADAGYSVAIHATADAWVTYQPYTVANWGGLPLTALMLDAKKKPPSQREYKLALSPKTRSSGLYLIKMRNANRPVVKLGRAKSLISRLSKYKTSLPLENEILIVACLEIHDPGLVVALERILILNMQHWQTTLGLKQLRRTEWYYKQKGSPEALVLRTFLHFANRIAVHRPKLYCNLHLYGKQPWNVMLDQYRDVYPDMNIKKAPVVFLDTNEALLADAEEALIPDESGFTKKELGTKLPDEFKDSYVMIESIDPALLT